MTKSDYYAPGDENLPSRNLLYGAIRNLAVYAGSYMPDILARPAVYNINPRLADGSVDPLFLIKFTLGALFTGLAIIGFVNTSRERFRPYHVYTVFHVAMIALINVYVARYLVSMLPFLVLFLAAGVFGVRKEPVSSGFAPGAILVTMLAALSFFGSFQQIVHARTGYIPDEAKSFVECNDWVKRNTPSDAVILSRKPSYTKLYTGRDSVGYMMTGDAVRQADHIKKHNVDFLIVGDPGDYPRGAAGVMKAASSYPDRFRMRYTTRNRPEDYVYEVVKPK